MAIWFISDLHLSAEQPVITAHFLQFLAQARQQAEALYILGDLFDRWLGDDDNSAYLQPIFAGLKQLTAHIPCYFIAGNRDFLLSQGFCQRTGITLLQEPVVIDVYGTPVLLLHGDTLCTDDIDYLRYRHKIRQPQAMQRILALPLWLRKFLAILARRASRRSTRNKPAMILDANPDEIARVMRTYNVQYLIHGHTHRPGQHSLQDGDDIRHWIVLGDWHGHDGWCVKWAANELPQLVKLTYSNGRDERI